MLTNIIASPKKWKLESRIKVNINTVLKDIDLLNKKNDFQNKFTFPGSPKYEFLDKHITYLDPYFRRIVFVTTHYIDEVDLLANRKMIISNGKISCLSNNGSFTNKIIEKFCAGNGFNKTANENLDYVISYLDHNNSIENFSLTATTLEELFINLENHKYNLNVVRSHKSLNMSPFIYKNAKWFEETNSPNLLLDYINIIESSSNLNMASIDYSKDLSFSSG
ncbi:hypothetical protein U3516DRAFT_753076 [Neocallimastix sp. 'constans']